MITADMNKVTRNVFDAFLKKNFPMFVYKGHANHVGLWETSTDVDKLIDLKFPNGDATRAAFRMFVHYPNLHGIPIHIEMYPAPYWEWESVFNGYVYNENELIRIFGYQLGFGVDIECDCFGNAICPLSRYKRKARCIGCEIGTTCEYKNIILTDREHFCTIGSHNNLYDKNVIRESTNDE